MLQAVAVFAQHSSDALRPTEVTLPPSTQVAVTHALLAILGAVGMAVAYYTNSTIKRPSQQPRYWRNAKLMFYGSLIPAPVAGWVSVAAINRIAPYTIGDYRYEWAVCVAGGYAAITIFKRLSTALLSAPLPGIAQAQQSEESN